CRDQDCMLGKGGLVFFRNRLLASLNAIRQLHFEQLAQHELSQRRARILDERSQLGTLAALPRRFELVARAVHALHLFGGKRRISRGRDVAHGAISFSQILRITRSLRSTVPATQPRRWAISALVKPSIFQRATDCSSGLRRSRRRRQR